MKVIVGDLSHFLPFLNFSELFIDGVESVDEPSNKRGKRGKSIYSLRC